MDDWVGLRAPVIVMVRSGPTDCDSTWIRAMVTFSKYRMVSPPAGAQPHTRTRTCTHTHNTHTHMSQSDTGTHMYVHLHP
jgi:hypothetical protein